MSVLDRAVEDYEATRLRFRVLAESNTYGLSPEARLAQSKAYHEADRNMRVAWLRLENIKSKDS